MARLIDADKLAFEPDPWGGANGVLCLGKSGGKTMATILAALKAMVANAPTVDAVPVVRCKDCKHFVQGEPYDPCECMKWTVKFGVAYTTPDGFCHKAERKDENP